MVSGRSGGREGFVCGEQYRLEEQLPGSRADWNLQGTMLTNPRGLSPCDADCPRALGSPGRLRTKGFFWSFGRLRHVCSERENWRRRGPKLLLCFLDLPAAADSRLVAKMTRTKQDFRWEEIVGGGGGRLRAVRQLPHHTCLGRGTWLCYCPWGAAQWPCWGARRPTWISGAGGAGPQRPRRKQKPWRPGTLAW